MTKNMFNKLLKIEKIKAQMEERKAHMLKSQTMLLISNMDDKPRLLSIFDNHLQLLSDGSEQILKIEEEEIR